MSSHIAKREPPYIYLPHRAVYDQTSVLGRVRAVFRHATDEWMEYLQHDHRVIAIWGATMLLTLEMAVLSGGWLETVTSEIPTILRGIAPAGILATGIYIWCLLRAPFQLHLRRLHRDLQATQSSLAEALAICDALKGDIAVLRAAHATAVAEWERAATDYEARLDVRSPRVYATFEWKGKHKDCYEPVVVHNDSDAPAQEVTFSSFGHGEYIVALPTIPHLAGRATASIWPTITNMPSLNGHPDFAEFMFHARISRAWDAAEIGGIEAIHGTFAKEVEFPFTITYKSIDSEHCFTEAKFAGGGRWGVAHIVIETVSIGRLASKELIRDKSAITRLLADNERLRERVAQLEPRRLSPEKKAELRACLGPLVAQCAETNTQPDVAVHYEDGGDCASYAREFADFLKEIGFRVYHFSNRGYGTFEGHDYHYGMWVRWGSPHFEKYGKPNAGRALYEAMKSSGFAVEAIDEEDLRAAELIVGNRRP